TRIPGPTGRRASRVWQVAATTNAVSDLAADLVAAGVEKVTVESTSDYWRIWFYLLEARGLCVWLVNARDVKNVPGRPKTDKLDAIWLAKLNERGMLRSSFVPPKEIRELRDYTRLRAELGEARSRHKQRLEKPLEAQSPVDPKTGEIGPGGSLPVLERLDEVPGIGLRAAQVIVAEIGLDMARFPTADHLVSWAKLSPRTIQSGPRSRSGKVGK